MKLSEYIVKLRIATRSATMCENVSGKNKNTLSLKTKILFLLRNKPLSPSDFMSILQLSKTNLAILMKSMVEEDLVIKTRNNADKREITYKITDAGIKYLDERLEIIESCAKTLGEDYDSAIQKLREALSVLEFII
ncbi:MAG: winged helix DNA-binding protein [Clostridia bacterium]|nr:winged helix DNA-binding protein [Clostridia bacterium]